MNKRNLLLFLIFMAAILLLARGYRDCFSSLVSLAVSVEKPQVNSDPALAPRELKLIEDIVVLEKNSSVYDCLLGAGLSPQQISALVSAAAPEVDFSRLGAGTKITILRGEDTLKVGIHQSLLRIVWMTELSSAGIQLEGLSQNAGSNWRYDVEEKTLTTSQVAFAGEVVSSLWNSAAELGLDAELINKLAEVFGWQIDFDRQSQPGDRWSVLIERLSLEGQHYGWGGIVFANYELQGESYTALRYLSKAGHYEYYDASGQSLRGRFLKSPLQFGRVSSFFQKNRFHPILGVNRPHLGVDYAAPLGTPVRAVADGTIIKIGSYGDSGQMISLRHSHQYQTAYKHLSRFSEGLRNGARVSQGQVIAFVGATGLATGPHLHFEFYENGQYIDPLGKKFPRQEVLSRQQMVGFLAAYSEAAMVLQKKLVSDA